MTSNKETIAAASTTPTVAVVQAAPSKASKANAIFASMFAMNPVPARKDMIARAISEAGCTDKGAATYLQNYKSKNGLVNKAAPAASVPATA